MHDKNPKLSEIRILKGWGLQKGHRTKESIKKGHRYERGDQEVGST